MQLLIFMDSVKWTYLHVSIFVVSKNDTRTIVLILNFAGTIFLSFLYTAKIAKISTLQKLILLQFFHQNLSTVCSQYWKTVNFKLSQHSKSFEQIWVVIPTYQNTNYQSVQYKKDIKLIKQTNVNIHVHVLISQHYSLNKITNIANKHAKNTVVPNKFLRYLHIAYHSY